MTDRWKRLHDRLCYVLIGCSDNRKLQLINRWYDWAYRTIGGES